MRLIDADALIERIKYSSHEYEKVRIDTVTGCLLTDSVSPTIDPVHAVNACYCKECLHSEPVEYKFADDWVVPIDEYWCNEHKINMPLNGFCSEGRKDDMKNVQM